MATIKITEKQTVDFIKDNAHLLITQPEENAGNMVETLLRAPIATIVQALIGAGINSNFILPVTVLFDENYIPIKIADSKDIAIDGSLSPTFATANTGVKTAFISSNVTSINGLGFEACNNLTDIYINNPQENITISESSKFPDDVIFHYIDEPFNNINAMVNALLAIGKTNAKQNSDIVLLQNNTNQTSVLILEKENIANKANSASQITDINEQYPTINYMNSLLENKVTKNPSGTFNYTATYDSNSYMTGSYIRFDDLVFVLAKATIKGGWADIDYPLPYTPSMNAACLSTDGTKCYRVSTSKENSHVYIHTIDENGTQSDGTIEFTLIYQISTM